MVQITRQNVVLAKIETTYGTDPTPTVGSNAVLVLDLELKPVKTPVERLVQQYSYMRKASLLGDEFYEISFKVEIQGSGSAGTAPRHGCLLRACGMSETIVTGGSPSVSYRDISASFESVTIWAYWGGRVHKITGCKGDLKATLEAGKQGMYEFTFMGKKSVAPAVAAIPTTATYDTGTVPVCKNGTFTYNSRTTLITPMLDFALQNAVTKRPSLSDTNAVAGFEITERNPIASINPETQVETSYDFYGDALTNQRSLSYAVGSIFTFTASKFNPYSPEFEDADGILHDKISGQISEDTSLGYSIDLKYEG